MADDPQRSGRERRWPRPRVALPLLGLGALATSVWWGLALALLALCDARS